MTTSSAGFISLAIGGVSAIALVVGCLSGSSSTPSCAASCGVDGGNDDAGTPVNDSGSGNVGFCDIENDGTHTCIDYEHGYEDAVDACNTLKGTYTTGGACSHASSVGGCEETFGTGETTIEWYYAPQTVDDAKASCAADPATYVAP